MTFETLASFSIITALLVISPGPNGVLIAKTASSSGRRAAFANILGFAAAFYVHCTLAVFGLSILLVQSASAFMALKLAGALYLIWIGVKALREAIRSGPLMPSTARAPARPRRLGLAVAEGFLTNVLNPKVALFYLAAFPQFLGPNADAVTTGYALTTLHAAINLLWFATVILFVDRAAGFVRSERVGRWLKGATGLVFIIFGLRLATLRP